MYPLTLVTQLWRLARYEGNSRQKVIKLVCCLLIAATLAMLGDRILC